VAHGVRVGEANLDGMHVAEITTDVAGVLGDGHP
jgi:hypothetical protein